MVAAKLRKNLQRTHHAAAAALGAPHFAYFPIFQAERPT